MHSNCKASLAIDPLRSSNTAVFAGGSDLVLQTNKASVLAEQLIESLRSQRIIVPAIIMIDRLCAEALARGEKLLYQLLIQALEGECCTKLDALLLPREDQRTVVLTWLRQPPGEPNAKTINSQAGVNCRMQKSRASFSK